MSLDEAGAWLTANEVLATWIGVALTVIVILGGVTRQLYQAISRNAGKRRVARAEALEAQEVARGGALVVEQAAIELPLLENMANTAGREELRTLARKAEWHLGEIRAAALRATDSALKLELSHAAQGVAEFRDAVMSWHGLHDSDFTQRSAGSAAVERVQTSAENLKRWV